MEKYLLKTQNLLPNKAESLSLSSQQNALEPGKAINGMNPQQFQIQNVVYNTKARDASQQRVSLLTDEINVTLYEVMNQV